LCGGWVRGLQRGWPSDVEALAVVNAELSKQVEGLFVLDAFTLRTTV
jgi:hypothetical protein